MKRGSRILLFLVLLIVILVAVAFLLLGGKLPIPGAATPVPTPAWVSIVIVEQKINQYDQIKAEALSTIQYPPDQRNTEMISDPEEVVGQYAAYDLVPGMPLMKGMVTGSPFRTGNNPYTIFIQPGQVAIAIPITRLNAVAYAIRDGDHVNVIATTMFVDLDSTFQSILPNNMGQIVNVGAPPDAAPLVVLGQSVGGLGSARTIGRAELDPLLNQAVYLIPSEAQRPRMVSQMILQDIQVLHVGNFELEGQQAQPTAAAPVDANQPAPTPIPVVSPDVITLIVSPQDAVALTYLMRNNVALTLTLRASDDTTRVETEAATLQYLLSQYAIPVPAKMPYGFEPYTKSLIVPGMDLATPVPRP
jgi:Flp pilus assembly protein CpaB